MSQISDEQNTEIKKIFSDAFFLYEAEKYKEALTEYQKVLSLIEETDDVAGKITVYTALAQVHSKLGESEIAESEKFNTQAIELLRKTDPKDFKVLRQIMSPIRGDLMMGNDDPDPIVALNSGGLSPVVIL
jgi:tetratricopeptide (TPR) repeat protein